MTRTSGARGMGWLPDYPDSRDFTVEQEVVPARAEAAGQKAPVRAMLAKVGIEKTQDTGLGSSCDLTEWFSPIEDQGQLGSCTAQAGAALVEYFERRAFGRHIDASRLFLYKVTRNFLKWTGDTGAFLRSTMGALVLFGVPPEEYWPYEIERFEEEPPAFCYAFGKEYQAIQYFRLDPPGTAPEDVVGRIKTDLSSGVPSMFGFTVFESAIAQAGQTGKIPLPARTDRIAGGHAVVAAGYDDSLEITNGDNSEIASQGAFRIRNSWGEGWGEDGYGWLPYDYVRKSLAEDWWTLLKNEWVDTGVFGEQG